LIFKSHIKQQV